MKLRKVELNGAEIDCLLNLLDHEIDYFNGELAEEIVEYRITELEDEIDKLYSLKDKLGGI